MSTIPSARWILLVTDRDETHDLVTLMMESLEGQSRQYPQVRRYLHALLVRRSSVNSALEALDQRLKNKNEPALIVIDAVVRHAGNELAPGDGTSASEILKWMASRGCATPVLVASEASLERIDHEVLVRPNVARWDMHPEAPPFAQALAGLDMAPSGPQRLTVEVGQKSARYRLEGHRPHTFDRAYPRAPTFEYLLRDAASLSPFEPFTHTVRGDWQSHLGYYGKALFQFLLRDGLDPTLRDMLDEVAGADDVPNVDIRFEIDLDDPAKEGLFALPFEIANSEIQPEGFLCARVPMARRIRRFDGSLTGSPPPASAAEEPCDRDLRMLFVNAAVSGTVTITHGRTGESEVHDLDQLNNVAGEQQLVKDLPPKRGARLLAPTIISGSRMRGQKLVDHVRETLTAGGHDIFHFSGHSITLSGGGGTFLVFPGKRGEGVAVSIQHIADWVREGGCRLVVLSSCRGSSLRTAVETMRAGAEAVLGFRWDVDDELCVEYFRSFYEAYLVKRRPLSEAYRDACRSFQRGAQGGKPLWASAVAVVRD